MAGRENEIDYRPVWTPSGSITITGSGSDSQVLSPICRRLYVGGTGDVTLRLLDSQTLTFKNVGTGTFIDAQFDQVLKTGGGATLMVALW